MPLLLLLPLPVLAGVAAWLIGTDKGRFPPEARELGSMARAAVEKNYGYLIGQGGRFRRQEARDILWNIVADVSEIPADRIARDTRICG